jgi:hypothetical protein
MTSQRIPTPRAVLETIQPEFEAAYNFHDQRRPAGREGVALNPYTEVPLNEFELFREAYGLHIASWAERGIDIQPVARATLKVDTATEAGLPYYTHELMRSAEPLVLWNRRWTTEEDSHGIIMVRLMEAREMFDMANEWQPTRDSNLLAGIHVRGRRPEDTAAYAAVQELLTQDAHYNSSGLMDLAAAESLKNIAVDEGRHHQMYLKIFRAIAKYYPDLALAAMRRQHKGEAFAMPGMQGIPNYGRLALTIAMGGVFDGLTVLNAQKQTIDKSGLLTVTPKTERGKKDQAWANALSSGEDPRWAAATARIEDVRDRSFDRHKKRPKGDLRPFILGRTVALTSPGVFEAIAA